MRVLVGLVVKFLPVVRFTLVPRNVGDSASMSSSSDLLIRWEGSDGWSAVEV